jgi:hypothetical protein
MTYRVPSISGDDNSAFDGDCDIAYALLLADRQWGSGGIDYRAAADQTLAAILASTIGLDSHLPLLGDWEDASDPQYNQYTPRSSDFILDHFRAFGRATGAPAWPAVVAASQQVVTRLQAQYSPGTGLLPDFIVPVSSTNHAPRPAPANFLEGPYDGGYYYNAGRDPWRIGTDALLNNDAASLAQTRKISSWAKAATGGLPASFRSGYGLNGTPLASSNFFTIFFVAPLGVAAMTLPTQQQWLDDVYDAVDDTFEDYYEDSVTLLCLLVMTGNYWDPETSVSLSPAQLKFLQIVGTRSRARTVTLANQGPALLTISSILLTGADAGQFALTTTCGSSLPAGGSCSGQVSFNPTSPGRRTAWLTIADDGVGSPHQVPLSGRGMRVLP